MPNSLLSTRRIVPLDRTDEYLAGWERVQAAVSAAGGRAWLFRAAARQDRYLEFVESAALESLLTEPAVAAALEELADHGPGEREEWEEAEPA